MSSATAVAGGTTAVTPTTPSKPGSAQKKMAAKSGSFREQEEFVFPLTPVATPTSAQHRKQRPEVAGGGRWRDTWEESFNRWVVLEGETLKEAKKTDQLAFLELEPIKVRARFGPPCIFRRVLRFGGERPMAKVEALPPSLLCLTARYDSNVSYINTFGLVFACVLVATVAHARRRLLADCPLGCPLKRR